MLLNVDTGSGADGDLEKSKNLTKPRRRSLDNLPKLVKINSDFDNALEEQIKGEFEIKIKNSLLD